MSDEPDGPSLSQIAYNVGVMVVLAALVVIALFFFGALAMLVPGAT